MGLAAQPHRTRGDGTPFCFTARTQCWMSRKDAAPGPLRAKAEIVAGKIDPAKPCGFRLQDKRAAMREA